MPSWFTSLMSATVVPTSAVPLTALLKTAVPGAMVRSPSESMVAALARPGAERPSTGASRSTV